MMEEDKKATTSNINKELMESSEGVKIGNMAFTIQEIITGFNLVLIIMMRN